MGPHTRFSLSTLAVGLIGAATAAAHVLLPFSNPHGRVSNLSPRVDSEQLSLKSAEYPYLIDVSVGTPPQKLSLVVSPSSGLTWVPDASTTTCSPDLYYRKYYDDDYGIDYEIPPSYCPWGSFNASLSETYLKANRRYSSFTATAIDGYYVDGSNFTDKLTVGDIQLDDFPMGLVGSGSTFLMLGVLGLGSNGSSSYYSSNNGAKYANFLDRLVSSGKATTPAYSIWLDNAEGTAGGLLFGAIDRSRYTGDLLRLPADPYGYSSYSYSRRSFAAAITSVNGTTDAGFTMPSIRTNDFPVDVTIGAADVFSYLPESLVEAVADMVGATYNKTMRSYMIPCDTGKSNATKFVFELGGTGGPTLNVETSDLVVPLSMRYFRTTSGYYYPRYDNSTCLFGLQTRDSYYSSSSTYEYTIGSPLLRRTYMVFDAVNEEVALAPVKFASGSDAPSPDIVAFESYGAHAPSATLFCSSGRCSGCLTSDCTGGSGSGGYGGGGGSGWGYDNSTSSMVQHWRSVAIGLGVTFGVLTLVAITALCVIIARLYRGDGPAAAKEVDSEDGGAEAQVPAPVMSTPGTLPAIPETQGAVPTQAQSPQLPVLAVTPPPPEPTVSSNRDSVAVSALSEEQPPAEASVPGSPKGKGKEVPT